MRVVVMGVTGCGKSTVARGLAQARGLEFADADDLHRADAVAQMAAGVPLTDHDRWPWLDRVAEWLAARDGAVIACSALRRVYRDRIVAGVGEVTFVHLAAPQAVLEERVRRRLAEEGHFAGVALLDSQYATLEPLAADEDGVTLDVSVLDPAAAVAAASARMES
ncbi:gluconokinase [Demequina globuliformis]|uniref:gluconokinase n=1 Tax=Demequina globuliformis TaxID=676202 RepID=UPI000782A8FD|nr:gluconokinase [Demequina globuliformis]